MKDILGALFAVIAAIFGITQVTDVYSQTTAAQRVQATVNDGVVVFAGVKKKYQHQAGGYGTAVITDANLITWGAAPSTWQFSTTELRNAWSGAVTVTGATDVLHIDHEDIPQADCIAILSETPKGAGVYQYAAAAALAGLGAATVYTVPVSPADATTACAAATNAVRFVMK